MSLRPELPNEYRDRMKASLSDDFEAFWSSYKQPPVKALRFNLRKARPDTRAKLIEEWKLEQVPWCADGYYYDESLVRPGLSPYHDAGVFYIQEPSAMLTGARACIGAEDVVLDLCAAPGGKTTQAADKAALVVANEPIPSRARILSSNIERMGFDNVIVTSAYPDELAAALGPIFDKLIVDAPCSGEGMMRKDATAIAEWSVAAVENCIRRQEEILVSAASLVRPGGKLIYSTCTFEYGENEGQIRHFLEDFPEYSLSGMERLYPHEVKGEGHFCAVLKTGNEDDMAPALRNTGVEDLRKDILKCLGRHKIHILRSGIAPGETLTDKKGRSYYVPSQAEIMASSVPGPTGLYVNLHSSDLCEKYLHGESLDLSRITAEDAEITENDGWISVYYDGYPLGPGKKTGHTLKNHYPKGLRHL